MTARPKNFDVNTAAVVADSEIKLVLPKDDPGLYACRRRMPKRIVKRFASD
jgi:hypothetical protein